MTGTNATPGPTLRIEDLRAKVGGRPILNGVNLEVRAGEVHALMGPNGSGKSTLAYALMGHPAYVITEGQILFDGEDVTELGADVRA
ncbi:MAG: ATP-binding cassette domain-containing protein, partial [Acidimicrobiia bacterium]